jgi:hypothetical protein
MARLKFVPKAGLLVPHPGRGAGDYHFAGRSFDTATMANVANAEPIDVEAGTDEAARFIQLAVRDGDLHPFDEATAKACGLPFVPVSQGADGEWVVSAKTAPAARKAAE